MSTELEVVSKAIADINAVSAGIANLRGLYGGVVYPVSTSKGMNEAKTARIAIREPRYEVERIRKAAKKPILDLGKRLDAEAARIEGELLKLETPIDEQIKTEEVRVVIERLRVEAIEKERVAAIHARIDRIRALPTKASNKTAAEILILRDNVAGQPLGDDFAEFIEIARTAHGAAVESLTGLYALAVEQEAEAARIRAEREELARLRKEQEALDAIERARIAEEQRVANEELRMLRETQAAEQRERQKVIDAENARIRQAQETAAQAERDRLAAERDEFACQQEAQRKAHETAPAPLTRHGKAAVTVPAAAEMVDVLSKHYRAHPDTIVDWLLQTDFRSLR